MAIDTARPAMVRIQALQALEQLHDARLIDIIAAALRDTDPAIRTEGRRILAVIRPTEAMPRLEEALAKGTLVEQQGAIASLGKINSPKADTVLATWLDKLLASNVPRELELDLLEAVGARRSPALKEKLAKYEATRPKKESIDPWRETLYGGDQARGKAIFFERAEVMCVRCHVVAGVGGKVGPELTKIAAEKPREYLLESVVDPNKVIAKGFDTAVLTLDDGRTVAGIVKAEDAKELTLMTPEAKLITVDKSKIDDRSRGKSAMPQDVAKPLSKAELRDLVEYLSSLR
jgi:quinoprotein glucose dehydrogenase